MSKKVSVIVPVYNVEKYLPKCLDSLVNQTLEDIEILVVNDGSPDNSQAIIDDYAARYPDKIRAFVKENGGLSDARNFAVPHATGEYIAFVDSDDVICNEMLSILYRKAKESGSDVVVCDLYKFNENMVKKQNLIKSAHKLPCTIEEYPEILFECKSFACNKLFRREWYCENKFLFPKGQLYEDSAVVYNMLYKAKRIDGVTDALYFYRVNREGAITNTISERVFDIFKSCKSIHDFYYSHTQRRQILDVVDRVCQIHVFVRMKELLDGGTVKMKWRFYREMINYFDQYMPQWTQNPYYPDPKKEKKIWTRIRHIPCLTYPYLIISRNMKLTLKKIMGKGRIKENNYYINKERLRTLQLIELDILKEIDRICKENNLTYYLGEGSLLGAIRHQGFIPWDDDLDILMPRDDYEKFRAIAENKLDKKYMLLCEKNAPNYYLPFTKIFSADNHGFISEIEAFDKKYSGPFVDIFPIDYADTIDKNLVERKYRRIRKIRDELLLKAGFMTPNTKRRKLYNIESKFRSYNELHKKLQQELTNVDCSAEYMCNFASSYHPSRQIVPKSVYGLPKYVKFEDGEFPVPQDAHTLLNTIYGNYMQMPPVRKRVSKHSFKDKVSMETIYLTKPIEDAEMERAAFEEENMLQ